MLTFVGLTVMLLTLMGIVSLLIMIYPLLEIWAIGTLLFCFIIFFAYISSIIIASGSNLKDKMNELNNKIKEKIK